MARMRRVALRRGPPSREASSSGDQVVVQDIVMIPPENENTLGGNVAFFIPHELNHLSLILYFQMRRRTLSLRKKIADTWKFVKRS